MTNKEFADGLRAAADFFERNPELSAPRNQHNIFCYASDTKEEAASVMRAFGSCNKTYGDATDDYMTISKKFGPVDVRFIFTRSNVCTRKVVGVETIPAKFIEAYTEPARTKEIVEWECAPILEPTQQADEAAV